MKKIKLRGLPKELWNKPTKVSTKQFWVIIIEVKVRRLWTKYKGINKKATKHTIFYDFGSPEQG